MVGGIPNVSRAGSLIAMQPQPRRIVILGGGFGGVYTAQALERLLKNDQSTEVTLVSKENYFTFQPMLPEVISGEIGLLDTVSPLPMRDTECGKLVPGFRLSGEKLSPFKRNFRR
jgi:hypothetical protein